MKSVAIFALLMLCTACNSQISSHVYLRDVQDVLDGTPLSQFILIGVPISSSDDCEDDKARYERVYRYSVWFKQVEYVRCYAEGWNDYLEFELEVPILVADADGSFDLGSSPFGFLIQEDQEQSVRHFYLVSMPRALCDLDGLLREEFSRSLDLVGSPPTFIIQNDLHQQQDIVMGQVFVNGEPQVNQELFAIDRRQEIQVGLSNVTAAWVFNKSCDINLRSAIIATWVLN